MNTFLKRLFFASALVLGCAPVFAQQPEADHRTRPWSEGTLEAFGSIPIQDGGRIKPVSTFASFTLLRLNGKSSVSTPSGEAQDPVAWLLDVAFFPEDAANTKCFLVSDSDAVTAIGVSAEGRKRRDRWSYAELQPGLERLFSLAHQYDAIEAKERSTLQQQVVDLASNVFSFVRLAHSFDWARGGNPGAGSALTIVAPVDSTLEDAPWCAPADLVAGIRPDHPLAPGDSALVAEAETLFRLRTEANAFETALSTWRGRLVARAMARGEYEHVQLERTYYAFDPIRWSLTSFVAAFLVVALMWLRPQSKLAWKGAVAFTSAGALLLVTAIVFRCIIRERPPVSTLYETVLFVTAACVLVAVFIECVQKARFAVQTAAVLGMIGLFVANGYETLDKQDTMPSLVAVLDTNFWLATHVTAITIGYSAGMLAAALASFYLVGKLCGWKRNEPETRRKLARTVYGVLCFAVIFSTVGTILGGIWANESWGRFWGWDPKENGALLIVISQIVILHVRRGGYLRDHGTCMAAAFGGTVVAFSWWGVNLLGVGLHSYGFTSGIHTALWTYYGLQWGVVGLGAAASLLERAAAKKVPDAVPAIEARRTKRTRAAA
jgi:ABC-type transport system involved in cytochrome c biogenesis permease subunit